MIINHIKKAILSLILIATVSLGHAQNSVYLNEGVELFTVGSHNSIIATVPYGEKSQVISFLKKELKTWKGKVKTTSIEEYLVSQAKVKSMGEKMFDSYVKIYEQGGVLKIAVATDLGGSYLNSSDHVEKTREMQTLVRSLALKASQASIENIISEEKKVLKSMNRNQKTEEAKRDSYEKAIENAKKQIETNEKLLQEWESTNKKLIQEIKQQEIKISEKEALKKSVH